MEATQMPINQWMNMCIHTRYNKIIIVIKSMKYWYMKQCGWPLKTDWAESRHTHKIHTVWFHLCKTLEKINQIYSDRNHMRNFLEPELWRKIDWNGISENFGLMKIVYSLTVVLVPWVYIYIYILEHIELYAYNK